jgi:hypothetical protein
MLRSREMRVDAFSASSVTSRYICTLNFSKGYLREALRRRLPRLVLPLELVCECEPCQPHARLGAPRVTLCRGVPAASEASRQKQRRSPWRTSRARTTRPPCHYGCASLSWVRRQAESCAASVVAACLACGPKCLPEASASPTAALHAASAAHCCVDARVTLKPHSWLLHRSQVLSSCLWASSGSSASAAARAYARRTAGGQSRRPWAAPSSCSCSTTGLGSGTAGARRRLAPVPHARPRPVQQM